MRKRKFSVRSYDRTQVYEREDQLWGVPGGRDTLAGRGGGGVPIPTTGEKA